MRIGVVVFPGSNCDHDAWYAATANLGLQAGFLWHDSPKLGNVDAVIVPGGFSYGDYLRCGAIAKFSPIIQSVKQFANAGGLVLGICNGFQILAECGLLPGALVRNQRLKYICDQVPLSIESVHSPFTNSAAKGQRIRLPIAHGEGCYVADKRTLDQLQAEDRIAFRYAPDTPESSFNGSQRRIAGILSEGRNVLGMMPHPERFCDPLVGGTDGRLIFESMIAALVPAGGK
jgi:phosphoribosylformylglycinamidine synthase